MEKKYFAETGISAIKAIEGLKEFDSLLIPIESFDWVILCVITDEVSFKPSFVCAIEAFIIKITKLAEIKYFMFELN